MFIAPTTTTVAPTTTTVGSTKAYISKPGEKCHSKCENKYGPCNWCGPGNSCCRKGSGGCDAEYMKAAITSSRCIGLVNGNLYISLFILLIIDL